ncbi:hypothetical protein Anapl_10770 [Anas platyrhynchos]|uniref:Uncharacterized protein n=1 Tax=Anas platyrhynchos TaxID=8839 RepID=R0KWA3_ANAPL|nr:hypothetical protein Anapl_10770 [Anas platyrhynchos]
MVSGGCQLEHRIYPEENTCVGKGNYCAKVDGLMAAENQAFHDRLCQRTIIIPTCSTAKLMESCSFHMRNHIQSSCSEATEKSKFLNGEGGVEPACLPLSDETTLLETTGFCSGLFFFPKGGHGDITLFKEPGQEGWVLCKQGRGAQSYPWLEPKHAEGSPLCCSGLDMGPEGEKPLSPVNAGRMCAETQEFLHCLRAEKKSYHRGGWERKVTYPVSCRWKCLETAARGQQLADQQQAPGRPQLMYESAAALGCGSTGPCSSLEELLSGPTCTLQHSGHPWRASKQETHLKFLRIRSAVGMSIDYNQHSADVLQTRFCRPLLREPGAALLLLAYCRIPYHIHPRPHVRHLPVWDCRAEQRQPNAQHQDQAWGSLHNSSSVSRQYEPVPELQQAANKSKMGTADCSLSSGAE